MEFTPFQMERWQSTWEHRVDYNLSESGVHPLTVGELLALGGPAADLSSVRLGYSQSNGTDELRALIASLHPGATDRSVVVTIGGAEANFVAFWELALAGRPAAVMLPNYMQVPGLIRNFQAGSMPFHLREEDGWRPDLDQLESALSDGAGFILVTNPNNPTGVALTAGEMDDIVSLADRHGAWILSDEVYRGAELGTDPVPSFWGRYDRVLVTNSLSKAYGLPGTRLGWVVGPEDVVERLWARTDYTTIAPPSVSDALARIALSPDVRPRILERTRRIIRQNLGLLTEWIESADGLFTFTPPDAGAITMVRYHADVPSLELAERLRVQQSLLIVPGAHFGIESTMRLGFGPPAGELLAGLGRLREGFAARLPRATLTA
ncbi:MAG: aminotransferase class I/II-fold pyridoxal phosphate-dependent enzyme [Gemmatimonadetes bacterium]|nr:aminotransferase class I/II-fold pyridoxal phosphate-dependent enzyme [Gemmatimonadota bacterium]MYE69800.1 aminotransferase class I/II-fold pyridoxal phosphate-dependent enzyme [Gemmatimonadota bacterium]MYJ68474.1 aminotransferase class I/II-fold pyridoxal phosphate-dependent enzyme [Gemmatimonadota bacterium]